MTIGINNKIVNQNTKQLYYAADFLFDHPEQIGEAIHSVEFLCEKFEELGFSIQMNPTDEKFGFKAVYEKGEGGVSIGLLCEYESMPNGHSCAHHIQGPIMMAVAHHLIYSNIDKPYKLVVYGVSQTIMMEKNKSHLHNWIKGIDVALQVHGDNVTAPLISRYTGVDLIATFVGKPAHETEAPWDAKPPLDAVILCQQGMEFLRGHTKIGTRFLSKLLKLSGTNGELNPAVNKIELGFRTHDETDIENLKRRLIKLIHGAAMMTDIDVSIEIDHVIDNMKSIDSLNKLLIDKATHYGITHEAKDTLFENSSLDFINVSHSVPSAVMRIAAVPENVMINTKEFLSYGKANCMHDSINIGASIISDTVNELIYHPELIKTIQNEFAQTITMEH